MIRPGKHTRLPITAVVRVYLPGAGLVKDGSRVTFRIAAQALEKVTALGEVGGGVGGSEFGNRIRQDVAPNIAMTRYPLDVGQGHRTLLFMEKRGCRGLGRNPAGPCTETGCL